MEILEGFVTEGVEEIEKAFAVEECGELRGVHGPSVMAGSEILVWAMNGKVSPIYHQQVSEVLDQLVEPHKGSKPGLLARLIGKQQKVELVPIENAKESFSKNLKELAERADLVALADHGLDAIRNRNDALDLWGAWEEADPKDFVEFQAVFAKLKSRMERLS